MDSRRTDLDTLLLNTHVEAVLQKQELYLSQSSNVEVFEAGVQTCRRRRLDEAKFNTYLKVSTPTMDDLRAGYAKMTDQERQVLLAEEPVRFRAMQVY